MTQPPHSASRPPLCVDLDGTLIKTDLMWESLVLLLRRNPLSLVAVLFWWTRGRAYLKQQLARRVQVNPKTLVYNKAFLEFLRDQKRQGRKLILATASDRKMAQPVFNYIALFDELLASDGKTNLRDEAKRKALVSRFGEKGFDYAGNSAVDLGVWPSAREAIVVNASHELVKRAAKCAKLGPAFTDDYSPSFAWRSYLNKLFIRSGWLVAAIAGVVLAISFPKTSIAGAAWIAPALTLAAAHGKRRSEAFWIGYIAGLALWLTTLYWLLLIPVTGYPILGWLALCAYLAVYPAVWVWMMAQRNQTHPRPLPGGEQISSPPGRGQGWVSRTGWAVCGAAAWVALEMIRARFLSGFPWTPLGASQFQMLPLVQIASLTGVYGVSFLVVWTSLSLYNAGLVVLRRPTMRYAWLGEIILPLMTILAVFFFGMARLRETDSAQPTIKVAFVQPSIPQTMIWNPAENETRFRQVLALSEQALASNPDLLLWPEAALPEFNQSSYDAITNMVRSHGVWMVLGADEVQPKPNPAPDDRYDVYNSAFLFSPTGELMSIYRKQNLVIFGEYIPLAHWLPFVKWFTPITGGFAAGNEPVPFELERRETFAPDTAPVRVKTSVLICFEDVFPQLVRHHVEDDTDFLVNITNDGWFGEAAAQWQHAASAVFRSVENGIPLLRCCNTGLTCWMDSHGRIRQIFRDERGSIYGVGTMTAEIPILAPGEKRAETFYNKHGDWFGWSCLAIAIAWPALAFRLPRPSSQTKLSP